MNELIEFLQNFFEQYQTQARSKINTAIGSLPPLEQVEAASEAGQALRRMKYCGDELMACLQSFDAQISDVVNQVKAKAEALTAQHAEAVIAQKKEAGEIVLKADLDAAVENARTQAVNAEREAVAANQQREQLISTRRAELVTGGVPENVAQAVNAELLIGDGFEAVSTTIKSRVNKLKELGIASPEVLQEFAAGIAVNQEGDAEFERRLGIQSKIAADIRGSAKRAPFVAGTDANAEKGGDIACI